MTIIQTNGPVSHVCGLASGNSPTFGYARAMDQNRRVLALSIDGGGNKAIVAIKLLKALYGHPDSGGFWENHCEKHLAAQGFKPVRPWRSCYFHPTLNQFLGISLSVDSPERLVFADGRPNPNSRHGTGGGPSGSVS